MQISREFVGSGDLDQIHDFKPVNVRKRKARSEDERACKRRNCIKKGKKTVEAELRKNTDARARRVMETGAEEEDEDEE